MCLFNGCDARFVWKQSLKLHVRKNHLNGGNPSRESPGMVEGKGYTDLTTENCESSIVESRSFFRPTRSEVSRAWACAVRKP